MGIKIKISASDARNKFSGNIRLCKIPHATLDEISGKLQTRYIGVGDK